MLKKSNIRAYTILGVILTVLAVTSIAASAQGVRTEISANGLFRASDASPTTGEMIQFKIDLGTYLFLDLNHISIQFVQWDFGDGAIVRARSLDSTFYSYAQPGRYTVTLEVVTTNVNFVATQSLLVQNQFQPNVSDIMTTGQAIAQFDFNHNNRLGDTEFFAMVDAWIANRLSDHVFFAAIDIWVADSTIVTATQTVTRTSAFQAQAQPTAQGITFSAQGQGSNEIAVQVFGADGKLVFQRQSAGNRLAWNLASSTGKAVANGVYFYVMTSIDSNGKLVRSEPQPIAIVR
ncbi:PKD domain-containing protein [Candidatus Acetothermia bacterium]|nr:PKD domain-containing protein [Candidatus Acetothermia bacterium]